MIGPRPIDTVGNCQKSGISHGCGYDESPPPPTSWRKRRSCCLAEPALEKRARVDAGRRVALDVDEVAAEILRRRVEEVVEADVVERRGRGEAGDVAAELGALAVGLHHHRQRVPADDRADAVLEPRLARRLLLVGRVDRVDVGGGGAVGQVHALAARLVDQRLDQEVGALGALVLEHRFERVEPLAGLVRIDCRARPPCQALRSAPRSARAARRRSKSSSAW